MNKKKGFSKSNTHSNNSFLKDSEQNPYSNKEQTSKESTMASNMDLTNTAESSNDIIDIDDSPDIATWNKEVTRNKEHVVQDIKVSEETKNKFRISKSSPQIPPTTTTVGLRREDNEENDDHI